MADQAYVYSGPPTSVTLDDGNDYVLNPCAESITLPDTNEWVQTLVAKGWLTEIED